MVLCECTESDGAYEMVHSILYGLISVLDDFLFMGLPPKSVDFSDMESGRILQCCVIGITGTTQNWTQK